MASTESEFKTQVRELTDYSSQVLSDDSLDALIGIAKRDIQTEAEVTVDLWIGDDVSDEENALFWTTSLYVKIKAGELEGVPMSLGDIDVETMKVQGEGYQAPPVLWYKKASKFTSKLIEGGSGYEITRVDRQGTTRKYGTESPYESSVDYGGDV